mmetsp:Transcript_16362/g.41753  ORF Transcript_16362/g.41753 Transcript_16362/m.41753 type:complete len:360 (-) Transcript_16362:24-1103(-)
MEKPSSPSSSYGANNERPRKVSKYVTSASSTKYSNHLLCPSLTPSSARPYESDPLDHCETPFVAYRDIEPVLFLVAQKISSQKAKKRRTLLKKQRKMNKKQGADADADAAATTRPSDGSGGAASEDATKNPKEALRIYDPFFCEGSCKEHLATLGFTDVYNKCEDFYAHTEESMPEHDVLITNPPFSADHIPKCLTFATTKSADGTRRPFFLLLPNFCYKGSRFTRAIADGFFDDDWTMCFLVPRQQYRFWAPGRDGGGIVVGGAGDGAFERAARSSAGGGGTGTTNSPFECMWFCGMPRDWVEEFSAYYDKKYAEHTGVTFAKTAEDLPERVVPRREEKRANPKARKRLAQKRWRDDA